MKVYRFGCICTANCYGLLGNSMPQSQGKQHAPPKEKNEYVVK
jgi:hypothetical protein